MPSRSKNDPASGSLVPSSYLSLVSEFEKQSGSLSADRPLKRRRKGRQEKADNSRDSLTPSSKPDDKIIQSSLTQDTLENKPDISLIEPVAVGNSPRPDTTYVPAPLTRNRGNSRDGLDSEEGNQTADFSDESDLEWEDVKVDINEPHEEKGLETSLSTNNDKSDAIQFTLAKHANRRPQKKAKIVVGKEERERRLVMHKIHLVMLLHHVSIRNEWCCYKQLIQSLVEFLPKSVRRELHPRPAHSHVLRTRLFIDGLRHAVQYWKTRFKVKSQGMHQIPWSLITDQNRKIEKPMDFRKFVLAVMGMRGSRDVGAQAFCIALRAAGIESRLICSLQPVDFTDLRPVKSPENSKVSISTSSPVYWVEAWDKYSGNWITVDPIVTGTVEVPVYSSKLEPAISDCANSLRYVVAFDAEGVCLDVTKRYASRYTSRTMKKRVSRQPGGDEWWSKALSSYERGQPDVRDLEEKRKLEERLVAEGLPSNMQDFKNHPKYVLERHLKSNEVLNPNANIPIGRIASKKGRVEHIYRREDVLQLHSAQSWYMRGRVVCIGQQPLKYITKRSNKISLREFQEDDTGDAQQTGLYAEFQTEEYAPPPVLDDIVPKNTYGNIDIYTPSMVPAGGVHLGLDHVDVAARLIGVDFAYAVTGFEFSKQVVPVKKGIVVAQGCAEAVIAVYEHILEEEREEQLQLRNARALYRWRQMYRMLSIQSRLDSRYGLVQTAGSPQNELENTGSNSDSGSLHSSDEGGFLLNDSYEFDQERKNKAGTKPEPTYGRHLIDSESHDDQSSIKNRNASPVPARTDREDDPNSFLQDKISGTGSELSDNDGSAGGFLAESMSESEL